MMSHVFKRSRRDRGWSVAAAGFVLCIAIASVAFFSRAAPQENRIWVIALVAGVYGTVLCVGFWEFLWHECSTVVIDEKELLRINPFRSDSIKFDELLFARWLHHGHAGIALFTEAGGVKLYFAYYEQPSGWTMIQLLRERIPEDRQQDWPLFCHRRALPRRIGNTNRPLRPCEVLLARRRWDWIFGVSTVVTLIAGSTVSVLAGHPRYLAGAILPLLMWIPFRYSTPKTGLIHESKRGRRLVWPFLWILLAMWPTLRIGQAVGRTFDREEAGLLISSLPLLAAMFYFAHRTERRKREIDLEAAAASVAHWEKLAAADAP
jgi:hypothetical protein